LTTKTSKISKTRRLPIKYLISGSLNCLASGTFLYVIFMELLPEQLHKRKSSRNIISIVGGFIFISLIQLLTLAEF
jgi:zinc transporter ZupT